MMAVPDTSVLAKLLMEEEKGKERREVRGHCYALITRTP
jgi:predicted nucleic acid-binding protein